MGSAASALYLGQVPYVAVIDPSFAEVAAGEAPGALEGAKLAALSMAPTRELREWLLERASFDPMQLCFSPCPPGAPVEPDGRERSLGEAARELDFRLRSALSQTGPPEGVLLERRGDETGAREGEVIGEEFGVVRVGGAVEYDIGGLPAGTVLVDVHTSFAGAPRGARAGARVRVDGRAFGAFGPVACEGRREGHVFTLMVAAERAHVLRVERHPAADAPRIARVVARARAPRPLRPSELARAAVRRAASWIDLFPSVSS
jgi:hypothetical protein